MSRATQLALVASSCAMVAARNTGQNYCTDDICIRATHDPIHLIDSCEWQLITLSVIND